MWFDSTPALFRRPDGTEDFEEAEWTMKQWLIDGKDNPELMTITDLAARTQLSRSFWYARTKDGSLGHHVMGPGQGGIRISEEQYQEYLRKTERGGEAPKDPSPIPKPEMPVLKHLRLN